MGRKKRDWKWDGKIQRPRCPRCREPVLTLIDGVTRYECATHGWQEENAMADYEMLKTSLGECWVVRNMSVVDEVPQLLGSMVPIWLDEEIPRLVSMPEPERKTTWARRVRALDSERAMRAANPKRTVAG